MPTAGEALAFLQQGIVPGLEGPTEDDRVAFVRACLPLPEFKERVWPHFTCFVDASNVARRRAVAVHETTAPKARLADLDAVVAELKRLRYVPVVVSDANLFRLIDEPYAWKERYGSYPHSVAAGRQADTIVLRALRKLPEAACVTNDRFSKPDEVRDFADVLQARRADAPEGASSADVLAGADRFYRHVWEGDAPRFVAPEGTKMPGAYRRLARRVGRG